MFSRFASTVDRLLTIQEAVEAAKRSDYFGYSTTSRGSYPSVNLFQNGDDVVLTAELPGVKKEDINIEIKENLIRITGKREIDFPEKSSVHRVERRNVKFDRTLKLPVLVDAENIKAEYENGILKTVLPRAERDKPRRIEIN